MKKGILAGLVLAAGMTAVILSTGGDPSICPKVCPGKECLALNDYCLVIDAQGKPKRVKPDGAQVTSVSELSADKQKRPMVCCVTDELSHQENMSVRWAVDVPENCHSWAGPSLHAGIEMNGVDLGHAKELNKALCGKDEGPARPGNWGPLPHCGYKCVNGRPVATPSGCDQYCNPPEEKEGPIGEWLPRGPSKVPPIEG